MDKKDLIPGMVCILRDNTPFIVAAIEVKQTKGKPLLKMALINNNGKGTPDYMSLALYEDCLTHISNPNKDIIQVYGLSHTPTNATRAVRLHRRSLWKEKD